MKKLGMSLWILLSVLPWEPWAMAGHGDGGAAVAAGLGGLMVGTMLGSASAESGRRSRVEDKVARVQREQDKEKVSQLQREIDKKEIEGKLDQQRMMDQQRLMNIQQERDRSNTLLYILLGIIALMFAVLIGFGFHIMNLRKKS